jgi:hypothetical protein
MPLDESQKERDRREGELADLEAEMAEFRKEYMIDDLIVGIDNIVGPIMKARSEIGLPSDAVVCNSRHAVPAWWVAKKYKLELVINPHFPENEVFVTTHREIDALIRSRVDKDSDQRRIIVPLNLPPGLIPGIGDFKK